MLSGNSARKLYETPPTITAKFPLSTGFDEALLLKSCLLLTKSLLLLILFVAGGSGGSGIVSTSILEIRL